MKNTGTLCVHPLEPSGTLDGAVTAAVMPAVAYAYTDTDTLRYPGFYSTYNQLRLGQIVANLEKGSWGMAYSSGMAAISTAILSFAQQGDHVLFSRDLYGGTWKLAEQELPKRGIRCSYAGNTLAEFEAHLEKHTKVIYLETPANPLLSIVPLKAIASLAASKGIVTIVDNTFATPLNQQPLLLGIDIVIHSGTKYLGGHNDLPFGVLVSAHAEHRDRIMDTAKMYGGSLAPQECYLAERSLKTLALRVQQHNANALSLAEYLSVCPEVGQVFYPGLPTHRDYQLACDQMTAFGGMLSFELNTTPDKLNAFLGHLELIRPALSLGGVESLICQPSTTSHRALSAAARQELGIADNLLRLSAGIEDVADLRADIEQAMRRAGI
ncbi:PLP-dependent transferase [Chitinophaga sp. G-6-1-13]|uniref:PLP-dependent transferase n=1 Tax=Chitinophaga fulva TaxID=2728842 RepID=A0A848GNK7_9BACT|nr:PLP-dependent aspartate aminotransferase family protein [Chitinophaga fulva]NML40195.1 PLP-dependent transferase [Chitinophaga fulva]